MTCETVQSAQNSSAMLPSPGWPFVIPPEQELASARKQAAAGRGGPMRGLLPSV